MPDRSRAAALRAAIGEQVLEEAEATWMAGSATADRVSMMPRALQAGEGAVPDERDTAPETVRRASDEPIDTAMPAAWWQGGMVVGDLSVSEAVQEGDVLVADPERVGKYRLATRESDPGVVGVVVGGPAKLADHAPVALSGIALCKVDADFGAIRIGDLLTVSPTPGHAMRSTVLALGTILAKALEPLASGRGAIRVMVMQR